MNAGRIAWSIVGWLSFSTAAWPVEQVAKLVPADNNETNYFGFNVDVSGEYIVVGAPFDQTLDSGNPHGAAYIFKRDAGNWVQHAKIYPSVLRFYGQFG